MENKTGHLEKGTEAFNKLMEEYSQELLKDGWEKESQGYKSLMALHQHLISTPQEQLEKEWAEVEEQTKGIEGPTVDEYFQSLNPQAMYAKGYSEGAKRYKELVEKEVKHIIEESKKTTKKTTEFLKEHPDATVHRGLPEDYLETWFLPKLQEIFDNN